MADDPDDDALGNDEYESCDICERSDEFMLHCKKCSMVFCSGAHARQHACGDEFLD